MTDLGESTIQLKKGRTFRWKAGFVPLLAWVVAGAWIFSLVGLQAPLPLEDDTVIRLNVLDQQLKSFHKKYTRYPYNLNELRIYAANQGHQPDFYDRYGQSFSYLPLSPDRFLLRSFGKDGLQNTLNSEVDASIFSDEKVFSKGVDVFRRKTSALVYPAAILLGCKSDSFVANAALMIHPTLNQRTLVVSFKKNDRVYYLNAPHDRVEEFYWVPKKAAMVYTGTGSRTQADGIYYWDLKSNSVRPLFTAGDSLPGRAQGQNKQLWLNLVGINEIDETLYAFIKPVEPQLLSPSEFYKPTNLWVVNFKEGRIYPSFINDAVVLKSLTLKQTLAKQRDALLNNGSEPSSLQEEWLNLPLAGDAEKVLLSWTNYCGSTVHTTALFPYCLWYLAEIYHQAYAYLSVHDKNKNESLRAFGAEIAERLATAPMAPLYLNSLGFYLYRSFLDGNIQDVELVKFDWP